MGETVGGRGTTATHKNSTGVLHATVAPEVEEYHVLSRAVTDPMYVVCPEEDVE